MDFLKEAGAIVDIDCNKIHSHIGKVPRGNGTTLKEITALTVFMEGKEGHSPQPTRQEARCMDKQVSQPTPLAREPLTQLELG